MTLELTPCTNRTLEAHVQAVVDGWLRYKNRPTCEYVTATANDQGEVTLHGRIDDLSLVWEVEEVVADVPGVRFVFNHILMVCCAEPVRLH
jgi:hypothetical protein